jgi:hypothetical protein
MAATFVKSTSDFSFLSKRFRASTHIRVETQYGQPLGDLYTVPSQTCYKKKDFDFYRIHYTVLKKISLELVLSDIWKKKVQLNNVMEIK